VATTSFAAEAELTETAKTRNMAKNKFLRVFSFMYGSIG